MTKTTRTNNLEKERITLSIGVISIYAAVIASLVVFIEPKETVIQLLLYANLIIWMGSGVVLLFIFLILSLLHLKYRDRGVLSCDFPFILSEGSRQFFFDTGAEFIALSFIYAIGYAPFFYFNNFIGIVISAIVIGSISFLARMSSKGR